MRSNLSFFDNENGKANAVSNDIATMAAAMAGNLVLSITPATTTRKATSAAFTRTVTVRLVDSDGNVHTWFNKAVATGVSIADTSSAGTASIASTTLTFVNGVAQVVVTGSASAWLANETNTLTVANVTVLGNTVTGGTSVETITA